MIKARFGAGVAQFELSVRVPHIVEGEDSGDRYFQLTPCDELGQKLALGKKVQRAQSALHF